MFNTEETILNRIVISTRKDLDIDERYKFMFHGKTHLTPGHYYYCYPVSNISYSRLVTEFHKRYKRDISFTLAFGGMKEM